jgi:hypothetical protein
MEIDDIETKAQQKKIIGVHIIKAIKESTMSWVLFFAFSFMCFHIQFYINSLMCCIPWRCTRTQ